MQIAGDEFEGIIFISGMPWSLQVIFAVNVFMAGIGHGSMDDLAATKKRRSDGLVASLYNALKPGGGIMIETMSLGGHAQLHRKQLAGLEGLTKRLLERRQFDFTTNSTISMWVFQTEFTGAEKSHTFRSMYIRQRNSSSSSARQGSRISICTAPLTASHLQSSPSGLCSSAKSRSGNTHASQNMGRVFYLFVPRAELVLEALS